MIALMLAVGIAAAPGPHKTKVAVLDVQDVSGTEAAHAKLLTQVIVGELPKSGSFDVISSSEIQGIVGFERQKQLLGCKEDSACLAELGGALGVDDLVLGQIGRLGKRYRLDLRLIDAKRSKVVASEGDFIEADEDKLADAAVRMLHKLLADGKLVDASSPTLAAGGLQQTAPEAPSRTGAYVAAGATVLLAAGATFFTLQASSKFNDDKSCYAKTPGADCAAGNSPDTAAHLADALWAGTLIGAGVTTWLFVRTPDTAGSGGELMIGGSF